MPVGFPACFNYNNYHLNNLLLYYGVDIVDEPGRDVFGNNLQSLRKTVECICPSCQRTLGEICLTVVVLIIPRGPV